MLTFFPKLGALLLLPVLALLAFLIYAPGLHGYFLFDDYPNIVNNARLQIPELKLSYLASAALSSGAGALGRPISMASFALDAYFHGINPYYFKLTNLCIHIVNGLLIYLLSVLLLATRSEVSIARRRWTGLTIAAIWLLHPLNLTSVLYIVQRMTCLSAGFTLMALICYTRGRLAMQDGKSGWLPIASSFFVLAPLSVLCKENGALFPLFALVVEACFFRFAAPDRRQKQALLALFGVTAILPCAALLLYTLLHPQWIMSTYTMRGFTLPQRLYTEARIVCLYVRLLIAPDLTSLAMYHDDIALSTTLVDPPITALACAAIIGTLVLALYHLKRHPVAAFAVLFFLVGHSMESSFLPLELAHEHRNYLPDFGLLFGLVYYLLGPLGPKDDLRLRGAIAAVMVAALAGVTAVRATMWGDAMDMKLREAEHHPDSIRANLEAAAFFAALPATNQAEAQDYYNKAYAYYAQASSLSPTDTSGLFGLIALNSRHSAPIEDAWVKALAGRLKNNPIMPSSGIAIAALSKCIQAGQCIDVTGTADTLFAAALRNPTLHGVDRANFMFAWADVINGAEHDPDRAVKIEREAAAITPNDIDEQLNLIVGLINAGHKSDALQVIEQSRKLDTLGVRESQLDYLNSLAR